MSEWAWNTVRHGFSLGNGESRRGVDLADLREYAPIAGCNKIVLDFTPDIVVAVDPPMVKLCIERGHSCRLHIWDPELRCYVRHSDRKGVRLTGFKPMTAGPLSVLMLIWHCPMIETVYLLGHDFYGVTSPQGRQTVNNMYKGTYGYAPAGGVPASWQNSSHKLHALVDRFTKIMFYRVGSAGGLPPGLDKMANVANMSYRTMYARLQADADACRDGDHAAAMEMTNDHSHKRHTTPLANR